MPMKLIELQTEKARIESILREGSYFERVDASETKDVRKEEEVKRRYSEDQMLLKKPSKSARVFIAFCDKNRGNKSHARRRIWNTKTGGGLAEHLSRRLAFFCWLFAK